MSQGWGSGGESLDDIERDILDLEGRVNNFIRDVYSDNEKEGKKGEIRRSIQEIEEKINEMRSGSVGGSGSLEICRARLMGLRSDFERKLGENVKSESCEELLRILLNKVGDISALQDTSITIIGSDNERILEITQKTDDIKIDMLHDSNVIRRMLFRAYTNKWAGIVVAVILVCLILFVLGLGVYVKLR